MDPRISRAHVFVGESSKSKVMYEVARYYKITDMPGGMVCRCWDCEGLGAFPILHSDGSITGAPCNTCNGRKTIMIRDHSLTQPREDTIQFSCFKEGDNHE